MQLVDCPGYGFAKASSQDKENWKKFMMQYLTESTKLHRVVMLIDIKAGMQDSDKLLVDMLTELNKIFIVVLTKADKVKASQLEQKSKTICDYMQKAGSTCVPVIHFVSSLAKTQNKDGYGMHELMSNMIYHLD